MIFSGTLTNDRSNLSREKIEKKSRINWNLISMTSFFLPFYQLLIELYKLTLPKQNLGSYLKKSSKSSPLRSLRKKLMLS